MIDISVLFAFIGAVILFLSTPGPVTVMVVNNGIRQGFLASLFTIIGTNLASLILILISFLVLYGVFAINEHFLNYLTLFGSIYLIYFAGCILKDSFDSTDLILNTQNQSKQPLSKYIKQGFLVGISNPKDILFFIAFFPLFFHISDNKGLTILILTSIWILLDYAILSLYGMIFSKISHKGFIAWTSRICSLILIMIACTAIYQILFK